MVDTYNMTTLENITDVKYQSAAMRELAIDQFDIEIHLMQIEDREYLARWMGGNNDTR